MEDEKLKTDLENRSNGIPGDENLDELWVLLKRSETFDEQFSEIPVFGDLVEKLESIDAIEASGLHKHCLTFARCDDIGKNKSAVSETEERHLRDCRFCARRIEKSGALPKTEPIIKDKEDGTIVAPEVKKSWWSEIFSNDGSFPIFGWRPQKLALAALAVVFTGVAAIIVFRYGDNNPGEQIASITDSINNAPPVSNSLQDNGVKPDPNKDDADNSIVSPNRRLETDADNDRENRPPDETEDYSAALAFLPDRDREAVRQSIRVGKIQFTQTAMEFIDANKDGNLRGAVDQLSPKNEATFADRLVFRWQNCQDCEYQVIISDLELTRIDSSGVLTGGVWQPNEKLPAGKYGWKVLVRKKGEAEFTDSDDVERFNVVGEAEKSRIEKAEKATKSNLVSAILYARAGLFTEAERELRNELKKNPKSAKARKMLAQIDSSRGK